MNENDIVHVNPKMTGVHVQQSTSCYLLDSNNNKTAGACIAMFVGDRMFKNTIEIIVHVQGMYHL